MKLGIVFLFFWVFPLAYGTELNLGECQQTARNYILQGSESDSHPGARLWNFSKFTKVLKNGSGTSCDRTAFNQALHETHDYYTYIKSKYKCPQAGVNRCDDVASNLAYIDTLEKLYDGNRITRGKTDEKCNIVIDPSIENLANDSTEVVTKLPKINETTEACSHIPIKDRRGTLENISWLAFSTLLNSQCNVAFQKGFTNNLKGIGPSILEGIELDYNNKIQKTFQFVKLFGDLYSYASQIGTSADFFSETIVQGVEFAKNLMSKVQTITKMIYDSMIKEYNSFTCLNSLARAEIFCSFVGDMLPEILISIIPIVGKEIQEAKMSAKVSSIVQKMVKTSILIKEAESTYGKYDDLKQILDLLGQWESPYNLRPGCGEVLTYNYTSKKFLNKLLSFNNNMSCFKIRRFIFMIAPYEHKKKYMVDMFGGNTKKTFEENCSLLRSKFNPSNKYSSDSARRVAESKLITIDAICDKKNKN